MLVEMRKKGKGTVLVHDNGRELEVPYDIIRLKDSMGTWRAGALIQDAFPYMTADEREFVMTSLYPDEWDKLFGEV